jgi:hypothetical protein
MPRASTTYWLLTLVLFGAGYLFFFEGRMPTTTEELRHSKHVLKLVADDVDRIKMRRDAWTSAMLERAGGTNFRLVEPAEKAIDSTVVARLLSTLEFLEYQASLPAEAADNKRSHDYGLDPPRLEVDLGLTTGNEIRLAFGNAPQVGSGTYLRVVGDETLFVVDLAVFDLFNKALDSVRAAAEPTQAPDGG